MTVPEWALPVFSVDTEEQAKALVVASCELSMQGRYIARELAREQTLENLGAFSDRLAAVWDRIKGRWRPA